VARLTDWDDIESGIFVGIALSGGGSRAANFSAAVLSELQRYGFLQHATALSSVSGGSLTAAYYGLHGQTEQWSADLRTKLRANFESLLIRRSLNPYIWVQILLTDFDRSDIMREVFDMILFGRATFGEFRHSPRILINATSHSRGGVPFIFTDENFAMLGSRLDAYPISSAVMASAAYPGAFSDVTLRNYAREKSGALIYEHLYDGGINDNLGITTLLKAVDRAEEEVGLRGCFLFVIDAQPRLTEQHESVIRGPEPQALTVDPDSQPSSKLIRFLINPNALHAADVLFQRYHAYLLRDLGLNDTSSDPYQEITVARRLPLRLGSRITIPCNVWHISLARLMTPSFADYQSAIGSRVNRIPTRFTLVDSDGRTPEALQDLLYEAADLLVSKDRTAPLRQACEWFTRHGLRVNC